MRHGLLPAAWLLAIGAAAPPPAASIEVTVVGVRALTGRVMVAVCPQAAFLETCPYVGSAPAHAGAVVVTVADVPAGRYALMAFADANANGVLDKNMLGVPKEGFGFSNDATRRFLPPLFSAAAFDHGTQRQKLTLTLRYVFS